MAPRAHDVEIAPLRRRAGAALIDGGLLMGATGAVMGGAVVALVVMGKDPARASEQLERLGQRARARARLPAPVPLLLHVASAIATLGLRNTPSPGMRAMHIRRADARTGGPISLRSSVLRQLAAMVWSRAGRSVVASGPEGSRASRGCVVILVSIAVQELPALATPRRRNLSDRVAGTVVVRA